MERRTVSRSIPGSPRPLAADGIVLHGERRQLTIMFCDLVGSTALSQSLDPEDLREVIRGFEECCTGVVERFGGHVDGFQGDGALVVFGYPQLRDHEPEYAIRAALELIGAVGQLILPGNLRLQVRVGIATGVVVVDRFAAGQPRFVGEAVNLAARLQGIAEPDAVVVARATKDLAGGFFDLAELGPRPLKGFPEPVPAWRVVGLKPVASRFEAFRPPRLAGFVGRGREMERLERLWREARQGRGRAVLICGEPGIGKSRLIEEAKGRLAGGAPVVQYLCSPHHINSALQPMIEQLSREAGFRHGDDADAKLAKLTELLVRTSGPSEAHQPWLAMLVSARAVPSPATPNSPEHDKQKTLEAVLWHLSARAGRGPVLLVTEDVHWLDPTSRELMQALLERIAGMPVLLLVSSRPPAPGWLTREPVETMTLDRLSRSEAAALVAQLAGDKPLAAGLVEHIVGRTDGVPLFTEELTRVVLGSGLADPDRRPASHGADLRQALPVTLQDSLMARLDQLDTGKHVAQIAAVIGREFRYDLLSAISRCPVEVLDRALHSFIDAALVFPKGGSNTTYTFKHALVRDVAYESLLKRDRRELHARVATALEQQSGEGPPAEPELLAHHYTEAGLSGLAVRYWALAAQRALERSANMEVIGHASQGLEILLAAPDMPGGRTIELNLQLLKGAAYWALKGFASVEVEQTFRCARDLAAAIGDQQALFVTSRGLYGCYYARGELGRAREQAERVMKQARENDSKGQLCVAHLFLGQISFWQGRFAEARREFETSLELYDPDEHRTRLLSAQIDPAVNVRVHLGWTLWMLGLADKALHVTEEAIAGARRMRQPYALAMGLFWSAAVKLCRGDRSAAEATTRELRALTSEHRIAYLGAGATVLEGEALIAAGAVEDGVATLRQGLQEFRSQQAGLGWPWAMSLAAAGYFRGGLVEDALATLDEGFAAARKHGERHWEAELYRLKGDILSSPPLSRHEEGLSCYRSALDLARRQDARALELRAAVSLARVLAADGEAGAARAVLEDAYSGLSEGFDTRDLQEAGRLLDRLRRGASAERAGGALP